MNGSLAVTQHIMTPHKLSYDYYVVILSGGVICVKAAGAAAAAADDDDDDYYNAAKLPLSRANSSTQRTGFDDHYESTGVHEAAAVSTEMNHPLSSSSSSSSLRHPSAVRYQPLNSSSSSSSSSSLHPSTVGRQLINRAIISERRQQALRKESIRAQKLR